MMQRVIRGTRDAKGNVFQKTPAGGVGRMRCGKCPGICTARVLPDGTTVMGCNGCGANYQATPLDGPKRPGPSASPKIRPL